MVPSSCHQQSSPLGILYGKYWVLIAEICPSNLQLHYPLSLFLWHLHILFSCPVIKICVAKLLDALDNTGQMHLHYSEAQSIDFSVNTQQS